jgi:hypothetical protein
LYEHLILVAGSFIQDYTSYISVIVISLLAVNFSGMSFDMTLIVVFNRTQFWPDPDGDDETIWGSRGQTKLWPSIVLLCVACVSTFLSIGTLSSNSTNSVILLSYLVSVRWANRLAGMHSALSIAASIFLLIAWGVSVGFFNAHDHNENESDMWSWSCQTKGSDGTSYGGINWGQFCLEQVLLPHSTY